MYIDKYHLKKRLQLGLAHPLPGETTAWVAVPEMKRMARRLLEYLPLFERFRVRLEFDCGMPLCLYSDQELGQLFKVSHGALRFWCCPTIDISPDMRVWPCLPLSKQAPRSLHEFRAIQDIVGHLRAGRAQD